MTRALATSRRLLTSPTSLSVNAIDPERLTQGEYSYLGPGHLRRLPRELLGAPSYSSSSRSLTGPAVAAAHAVSPVLPGEPLRSGRDHRRRQAQPGSHGTGYRIEVLVVDGPEGGMRIITERPLHAPRGLLIGEPRCQRQRRVYAGRHASRADELAVLYPTLSDVLGPE